MSFVTDIFAAKSAAKGQSQAAGAARDAAAASTAEQARQYDQSRADNQPWLTTGTNALADLQKFTSGDFSGFQASPDYQFNLNEGTRALTARNAALGIQDSGAAQKSALQFSQGLANQNANQYANRLSALAGVGQTAAGQNQALGQNYANSIGQINQNQANALGSSYTNRGNIYGNLYSQIGGRVDSAASQLFGMR